MAFLPLEGQAKNGLTMTAIDVAVIGGGPGGLSAAHAILRARPQTSVAVFERNDLRPRGASFGVVPNGIKALEAINPELREHLQRWHTAPTKSRRFDLEGNLVFSSDDGSMSGRANDIGPVLNLAWHSLQRALADALPEGVLYPNHGFLSFADRDDRVAVELSTPDGPKHVEAQLLIGCDGGQSLVREQLLGDGPPNYLGTAVWRAVRPMPEVWPVDHGWCMWGTVGQAALLATTLGDGTLAWQAFLPWPADKLSLIGGGRKAYIADDGTKAPEPRSAENAAEQRLARAIEAFKHFPDPVPSLIATTDPGAVTEHGQFCREAEACQTFSRGRVALAGDCAHLMTPMLGQGCSQAIEDALELGRAIGQYGPTPEALQAYQAVRVPMATAVQAASVQLFKDIAAGTATTSELDVNIKNGFLARTFEPLCPASAAAAH